MASQSNASGFTPPLINDTGLFLLPIRGEKRIITSTLPNQAGQNLTNVVGDESQGITGTDLSITAAVSPFVEYVQIRIPGRGQNAQGQPDTTQSAYFQFLINPSQMSVTRQHLDAQAFSRSGWQIGVWGEDFISITLEGKTPGRYFARGLTDEFADLTLSFRNLAALELVVENNGYWFEGEQANEGSLSSNFSRRQIKMHSDVELTVGEFIWSGMFESLDIREDVQTPFLQSFSLVFIAWREHFRKGTPYPNPIGGSVERGHIPEISLAYGKANNPAGVAADIAGQPPVAGNPATIPLPLNISPSSSGLTSLQTAPNLPATDASPVASIFNPTPTTWNLQ